MRKKLLLFFICLVLINVLVLFMYFSSQKKDYLYQSRNNYYKYIDHITVLLEMLETNTQMKISKYELFKYTKNDNAGIILLNSAHQITYTSDNVFQMVSPAKLLSVNEMYLSSPLLTGDFFYQENNNYFLILFKKNKIGNKETTILLLSNAKSFFQERHKRFWLFPLICILEILLITWFFRIFLSYQQTKKKQEEEILKEKNIMTIINEQTKFAPLIITDAEGKIQSFSSAAEDLLGFNKHDMISKPVLSLFEMDSVQNFQKDNLILLNNYELFLKNKLGKKIICMCTVVPYYNDEDVLDSYILLFNDITNNLESREILMRELSKTKVFAKISALISGISDPKIIIRTIIEYTKDLVYYDNGTLFMLEGEFLRPYYTTDEQIKEKLDSLVLNLGEGLTGLVAQTQKGMFINSAQNSPIAVKVQGTDDLEECLISVPLIHQSKIIGVLTFSRMGNNGYTEEDLNLLETLATQAANVLESTTLFQKLSASEKNYNSLINESIMGIAIIKNNQILFLNNSFAKILDYPLEEIINKSILDYISKETQTSFGAKMTQYMMMEDRMQFELAMLKSNNRTAILEVTISPIQWEDEQVTMFSATDITEKIELNKQLQQTQKMESMGALAGGIAHDFKNILAGIIGATDMILFKIEKDSPLYNNAKIIKKSAERGASLAHRLLGYSRREEQINQIFNINDIILEVADITSYTFEKNIDIVTNLAEDFLTFEGDPVKIQQIILNLCVNARDAMPRGGTITIESSIITARAEQIQKFEKMNAGIYNYFKVMDTGTGIPEEIIKEIFSPFFTTKEKGKGTGLGLATTQSIVEGYNGVIVVTSVINVGTTFHIYLPFSNKDLEIERAETTFKKATAHNILVVDDEEIVLEIAQEILEELGSTVHACFNGEEALKYLETNSNIQLILADKMMPKMDGITLFKKVRELYPSIRVIISSGFTEDKEIKQLREEGLFGYITKPYHVEDLVNLLNKV